MCAVVVGAVVAAVGATVAAVSGAFVVGLVGLVADSEDDFSDVWCRYLWCQMHD